MWTAPLNVVRFDATTLWHFDAGSGRRPPHHSQQMQRALKYIDVRFDPKATVSDQSVIRREGPKGDSCTAANSISIQLPRFARGGH